MTKLKVELLEILKSGFQGIADSLQANIELAHKEEDEEEEIVEVEEEEEEVEEDEEEEEHGSVRIGLFDTDLIIMKVHDLSQDLICRDQCLRR